MRTLTNRIIGLVLALAMLAGFVLVPTPMDLQAHAATDYYLFGWINGADYGCESDHATMGKYKFENGKLEVCFETDSYVGIKTTGNADWYMTQSYVSDTKGTFHNTKNGASEKMLIPGGVKLTLSLTVNSDGTLSLSYAPTPDYVLFGWINGANYGCENDAANIGQYKFVNGQIIVHFEQDSYVGVKTSDNANWYMAQSYVSDTTGILYNTNTGACEKMFIPGGRDVLLTLIPHKDDTLTLMRSGDECVHSYTSKVTTKPTCTAEGVETFTCSKCGDTYRNILGATGHSYKSSVTTAATCTANGVKTFKCSACNHSYTEAIAATGHSFKNGKCSVCGKVDPNCDHNYKSTVTTAATCEKQGLMTYKCSKCGDVYTAAIPAAGHKYVDIVVPPTCDNNGYTQHKCSVCGNYGLNTDAVNPIGHNYSSVVTAPTCTEKGYTTYTCANCGHVYTWNETAATGHRFAGGTCTGCGLVDKDYVEEFYLIGWINGADCGIGQDYNNLGNYKFENGKLTVTFTEDSYVAVKTGDNALWYMTHGWLGEVTSATLQQFSDPFDPNADKLLVSGGQTVIFTLTKNADKTITLSYTVDHSNCTHSFHDAEGICSTCGVKVEHSFQHGVCGICGLLNPNYIPYQYYLYGFINGGNYGCEDDYANLGEYKFVDGKLTAIFTEDCYVGVKEVNPNKDYEVVGWYVTDGWLGTDITSTTLYDSSNVGNADKLYVPGGAEITFTLVANSDGTLTLSYKVGQCHHLYGNFVSNQPTCTNTGLRVYTCGYCGYSYTESIPALGHNYVGNICTLCGDNKNPTTTPDYYLCGYINGVDYGIGADMNNIGTYKFVNGKLTVTFTEDSYIAVKTGDNSIWYMTNGYVGEASSAVLFPFYDPIAISANKLLISGGQKVHFTLSENWDGNLLISYKVDSSTCKHTSHTTEGICEACDSAVNHSYVYGVCTVCGGQDPNYVAYDYYLFGYINGANYGCEEDAHNLGHFRFRSGTRTATFTEDSYVGVKAVNPGTGEAVIWYMTDGWQGLDATSVTLYDSTMLGNADKLYVPGGMKVTFTLVVNEDGTLKLSYVASECPHTYDGGVITVAPGCTTMGLKTYTCTLCNNYYVEHLNPTGHNFSGGKCTVCGEIDAGTEYYLFGFINNENLGCENDYENMGPYKFVDGKLTVRFDSASFVGIKTTGNADWYMTMSYTDATSATFYNVNEGSCEKMYIPGNAEITMTLTVNADGTLTLSYVAGECDHLYSSYVSVAPGCETTGIRVHTCGYCGHSYEEGMAALGHHFETGFCTSCGTMDPNYVSPDYYLFGYINGADYGWKDDINNLGYYKFDNGKLTVRFDEASYVAVKSGDNKRFFMVNGYVGEVSSATLVEFSDPNAVAGNRLYVPGGVPVNFTLGVDHNGNLTLSYTLPPSACHHPQHSEEGICPTCGTPVGHYYENGVCNGCGATDPSYNPYEYYLFGFINGANYGHEDDYANVGEYKFVDGTLTTTFTEDSYVGVKEADPNGKFGLHIMGWYMTDGWQGTDITSVTLYNSDQLGNADKLYVPGGVQIRFTLVRNEDGTLNLSYETVQCKHSYTSSITTKPACVTPGVKTYTCSLCGDSYTEALPALEHSFTGGKCDLCGIADPGNSSSDYYLFGFINGANYGCEDDHATLGIYKFNEGKLTVTFTEDSYVGIKTGNNNTWYMTDGWQGTEATSVTLYNSERLANADKLFIPAGVETILTLQVNEDGTLTLNLTYTNPICSHNYTSSVTTAPTCDKEGVRTFTCTKCDNSYTAAIAALGHSYKSTTTQASCDKEGVKTFTCTTCGHSYTEKAPATGHSYTSKVTAPTCDKEGYTTYTCSKCGNSYTDSKVAATGHSYNQGTITTSPTCENEGVKTYTCTKCSGTKTEKVAATGHNHVAKVTPPTCDKEGYTTYTCSKCGNSYTDNKVAATGHTYNQGSITTAPGCEKDGEKTFTCTKCGNTYTEKVTATGHNYVSKVTPPTCDKEGYTTYTCTKCGNNYTDNKTAATGHVYNQGSITTTPGCDKAGVKTYTCTKCGNTKTEEVAATGHNYISKVTPPTCTAEGFTKHTCSKCGNNYTDSKVAALGHRYNQGTITTSPGCEKDGEKTFTCTGCGETKTEKVAATGHNYVDKVVPPTCSTEGYTTHTCTKCGNKYTDGQVPAGNHTYNQGSITTSPSCEKEGERTFTCTSCGNTKTEKVAATGHNYVDKVTPPTCTTEGFTKHTCTKCGNNYIDGQTPAGQHTYNQGTITTSPGCEKDGEKTFTCSGCGATSTEKVPATGHNYVDKVTPPTCTTEGGTKHTCTKCGNNYTDNKVEALGHRYNQGTITTSPGCEKEGVRTFTCTGCGTTKTEAIAATGHNYVSKVTPPTCSSEGFTTHTCSKCGNNYINNQTPMVDHNYADGKCTTCGHEEGAAPVVNYYLFGYINGSNYACEEDAENLGQYKFVNGKLTATFTKDSYVGIKTGDNATWYMTDGWLGNEVTSATLYNNTTLEEPNKLFIPGGSIVEFNLNANEDGSLTLGYTVKTTVCVHSNHNQSGICTACGVTVPHSYAGGICTGCGAKDESYVATYYLFGFINGANYGCDEDFANLGQYQFVDGKLTVTFQQDSYVGIKTGDNAVWYMTKGWLGNEVTSATLYNSSTLTEANKLFVPGGVTVHFTLKAGADNSLELSYTAEGPICKHPSHNASGICTACGTTVSHSYAGGVCSVCGGKDPSYVASYYLFGFINGANYACEEDHANLGQYQFVDGKLTVSFSEDSYVGIKTGDNAVWYMTNGWLGKDVSIATLYNSATLTDANKFFIPGGKTVTFTLNVCADNTLELSYSVVGTACTHVSHSQSGICSACGVTVKHTFAAGICTGCGLKDAGYVAEYYLFGFINGANYGYEEDYANLGVYKFVDGKLTVTFNEDSYVGIKTGDNATWYMTDGWLGNEISSATLYVSTMLVNANKLFVPGGKTVTFTLKCNADNTITLSYTTASEEVGTGSISGTITDYGTDDVTVELWTEGATAASYSVTASNGTYSIENVKPGTYTLKVSKTKHVTRTYIVTIGENNLAHNVTIYLKGDVTLDGKVNVADTARIYAHVRGVNVITDPYVLSLGEVTGEGKVNIADVARLYSHVRGTNPLW